MDVYAVDDEVELYVNGESMGRKPAGAAVKNKTSFEVTYQPGTVEVIGYRNGQETERCKLVTASDPAALRLTPEQSTIPADGGSIAYIDIAVQDRDGVTVKHGEPPIAVGVSGAGELIALGSANPVSEELYVGGERTAYQGHLLAVVRSNGQPGEIVLTARMEGLPAAQTRLQAK